MVVNGRLRLRLRLLFRLLLRLENILASECALLC
jgi:hypothetical protein